MHVARLVELTHGRIDNGKSGPPLAPCAVFGLVLIPLHPPVFRVELVLQHLGVVPKDLKIELPPDQFADELPHVVASGGTCTLGRILGPMVNLANGKQSVTQVLRDPRCPIFTHQITRFPVSMDRSGEKFLQPRPRRFFPGLDPAGEILESPMRRRRQCLALEAIRRIEFFQRRTCCRLVQFGPRPRVRCEDPEIPALARLDLIPLVDGRIFESPQFASVLRQHLRHAHLGAAAEQIRIPVGEDRLRFRLARQFHQRLLGLPLADDQPTPDGPQISVQGRQRPAKKRLTRRSRPTVFLLPIAHHIDRNHLLRLFGRRGQRRIICHPQIPPEPVDGCLHRLDNERRRRENPAR